IHVSLHCSITPSLHYSNLYHVTLRTCETHGHSRNTRDQEVLRRGRRGERSRPAYQGRGVSRAPRPLGLREEYTPPHDRRPRDTQRRRAVDQRRSSERFTTPVAE